VPLDFSRLPVDESRQRAASFYAENESPAHDAAFRARPVPRELIELAIRTAGTAPSGAHQQPWTFRRRSDPELKQRIRAAAEREEHAFYHGKAPREWLEAILPLGTDEHKPHLTDAPWLS
jgi:nitroreductase